MAVLVSVGAFVYLSILNGLIWEIHYALFSGPIVQERSFDGHNFKTYLL